MASSAQKRVIEIISEKTGVDRSAPVTADTELINAGLSLDSVLILEILLALEKEFKIELNAQELFEAQALRTVGSLSEFIEKKLA
jgi:acyl carrier protein